MKAWKYTKAGKVLLLKDEDNFACLPTALQQTFGQCRGVAVEIHVDRPLVGGDGQVIKSNLESKGWHLWPEA